MMGKTIFGKWAVTAGALVVMSGCAHSAMRGSVAMKVGADEAHVCMGDQEVKVGDRVAIFKNQCSTSKGGVTAGVTGGGGCKKVKLGEGSVTKLLNEHYSAVKPDAGVVIEEGNVVELL